MPMRHDGGAPPPIVTFEAVAPVVGGGGTTEVVVQSGTVTQAVAAASQAVKAVVGAPSIANLPANATPGQMYTFPSQPSVVYVYGFDNIWRALLLVPVV